MDNSIPLNEEKRNQAYNQMANELIAAVENGVISYEEMQEASYFILNNLDEITTEEGLMDFTSELHERWPFFQSTQIAITQQQEQQNVQEEINQVKEELQQMTTS